MTYFTVSNLRVNYRKNPLGIDDARPRLSWELTSERRGFVQSAYQIEVAHEDDFLPALVWDSGKIDSDRNVHIEYAGPNLKSRTRYYFRIRVWDNQGMVSAWSEPSYWETALLASEEWQASWITAPSSADDTDHDACDYLRSDFTIEGQIVSARVYATSLGLYRLFVNGVIADDTLFNPGFTSYTKRLQYQTYDVTALISQE